MNVTALAAAVLAQAGDGADSQSTDGASSQGDRPVVPQSWWERAAEWATEYQVPLILTGAALVLAVVFTLFIAPLLTRRISDPNRRHKARRAIGYASQIAAVIVIVLVWARETDAELWVGLLTVGLALALQNAILCFAGWLLITFKRPFEVGDRIQVGNLIGDVIDIGFFQTYVMEVGNWVDADQSTGRVSYIPNSVVFQKNVFNYTQGFPYIWHELPILVTFESDWRRAKSLLERIVQEESEEMSRRVRPLIERMKRNYPIRYRRLTPIVWTEVRDSGVLLTIRFLTQVRQRRKKAGELFERILAAFADEPDIHFAYPTWRVVGAGSELRAAPPDAGAPEGRRDTSGNDDDSDESDTDEQ